MVFLNLFVFSVIAVIEKKKEKMGRLKEFFRFGNVCVYCAVQIGTNKRC